MEESAGRPSKWWRRRPMAASGIVRLKTAFILKQPGLKDRRKLWRPPLWVNVALLAFVLVGGAVAAVHRQSLNRRFAALVRRADAAPFEIKRIRQDLAEQELDEKALSVELDSRLKYARSQKAHEFYIVLDTKSRKFAFKYGDKVVRDTGFEIGKPGAIEGPKGARWTFAPVTGAFAVAEKLDEPSWKVPRWVYAMNKQATPAHLPTVPGGLGKYVLSFSDGYLIHSPPPAESPLKGAKPGSFMVPEADLAAIWRRVGPGTRIYIF